MPLTKIAIFWKRNIWNSVSWRPATLCLVAGRGCPFGTFVLLKRETFSKKPWKKPLLAWRASISCFLNSKIRMVSSLTILLSRHTSRKSHQYPCSPLLPNIHPFFQRKITFFLFPCQFDICSFFPPNHASYVFYVQLLPQDSASLLGAVVICLENWVNGLQNCSSYFPIAWVTEMQGALEITQPSHLLQAALMSELIRFLTAWPLVLKQRKLRKMGLWGQQVRISSSQRQHSFRMAFTYCETSSSG